MFCCKWFKHPKPQAVQAHREVLRNTTDRALTAIRISLYLVKVLCFTRSSVLSPRVHGASSTPAHLDSNVCQIAQRVDAHSMSFGRRRLGQPRTIARVHRTLPKTTVLHSGNSGGRSDARVVSTGGFRSISFETRAVARAERDVVVHGANSCS